MESDYETLYKEILLMSTALKGTAANLPKSTKESSLLQNVQAFATLLTVTTPTDSSSANVVAVTGVVGMDSLSTVVTARNRVGETQMVDLSEETISARARDSVAMGKLANAFENGNPEFHVHLQDVATFVEHLRLVSLQKDDDAFVTAKAHFLVFIHRRAFEKIHARMNYGNKLWSGGDPLAILASQPVSDISPTLFKLVPSPFLNNVLHKRGLVPNGKRFTINTANAAQWLGTILELRGLFNQLVSEGTQPAKLYQDGIKIRKTRILRVERYQDCFDIIEAMYKLCERESLVQALTSAYAPSEAALIAASLSPPTEGTSAEDEETRELVTEGTSNRYREYGITHAFRYYRTFTSWTQASFVMFRLITRLNARRIEFHLVSPTDVTIQSNVPTLTKEDVVEFMVANANACKNEPFKSITDTGDGFEKVKAPVHCEAQLMGLIHLKVHRPLMLKPTVSAMLPDFVDSIPIGIGKKCCFMCHLFGKHIARDRPEFILPGTHGIIHPWVPPPYIDDVHLVRTLHWELKSIFRNKFSPPSSYSSSPADDSDEDWRQGRTDI
ncbi:hypothetical protein CYLTODRAFT_419543 [Cylindrobasidium torrendii FP15055 ss-10]|uniref:Uncharacterized protein n=1 Tax=Cylindrobasidium torrendii FP15055 ss-10 TaxID=1314674 RepID=A0A0D7BKK1_9AGAR|nr:hypothetical protein CYLTODRAFT_419543 [Cylindrobasidium torrendii FP15055 ss-10]